VKTQVAPLAFGELPPREAAIELAMSELLRAITCLSGEPLPDFRHRDPITGAVGI